MLDRPILGNIFSRISLSHAVDCCLLHSEIQTCEIAHCSKERKVFSIQGSRPVLQAKRHKNKRAEPHDHVRKKNCVRGFEDTLEHCVSIPDSSLLVSCRYLRKR